MPISHMILWGLLVVLIVLSASLFNFVFNPRGLGPEPARVLPKRFFDEPAEDETALELLVGGEEAFAKILEAVDKAESSIHVQTYIWKDDKIGNRIAEKLRAAANRGVKVTVCKDALGTFFELGEILAGRPSPVLRAAGLKGRAGIEVKVDLFADTDHSKYFIVDRRWAVLGGMNIADEYHLQWHDYMAAITSPQWATAFERKVVHGDAWPEEAPFFIAANSKKITEIRTALIEIIDRARTSLIIEHAYFSTDKVIAAVMRAAERGVDVRMILPKEPDTHVYANWVTINALLRSNSKNPLRIFLYPKMMHAKVVLVDGAIAAVGSANLTLRSMLTSREVTLFVHGRPEHPLIMRLHQQLLADMAESEDVTAPYIIDFTTSIKAKMGKYVW